MNEEEINVLARSIADVAVISLIESEALPWEEEPGQHWLNLDCEGPLGTNTFLEEFEEEIQYAEARGLIRHHPGYPNIVQIVEG